MLSLGTKLVSFSSLLCARFFLFVCIVSEVMSLGVSSVVGKEELRLWVRFMRGGDGSRD